MILDFVRPSLCFVCFMLDSLYFKEMGNYFLIVFLWQFSQTLQNNLTNSNIKPFQCMILYIILYYVCALKLTFEP